MKPMILSFADANMAGFSWRWEFYVERKAKGFRLSARQVVCEDIPTVVDPVDGLRDGADIYRALDSMLCDVGYSLNQDDVPEISRRIAILDPKAADEFRRGQEILDARDEAEAARRASERDRKLAPFRSRIDAYVLRFSDAPFRNYGGNRRVFARAFIEQYVLENGRLPTGEHHIRVGGYSGGSHDFTDLHS
ncbi:hypothetical protein J5Y09_18305 [Roseomonas sp. PWR1]|uniref:Uncharacterized protein n=1 Tax=Roseomonas nitratireducens TaxID=2820810 RepID=A0ABS4AWZ2_9PROT|nr:hypothetical protein [Neoroseomonas nitratireducens]MBP0465885.1 hypothetical protein [Neoroseomonas nitratireducens]